MNRHPRRYALLLAAAAALPAACATTPATPANPPKTTLIALPTPAPPVTATPVVTTTPTVPQSTMQQVEVTFYAAADNDPAGSTDIAYPNSRHAVAGGSGTYQDPLTLATDPREIRPGVLVYYPPLQKYFVMEDDCAECIEEWTANHNAHVDLWISASPNPAVQNCEAALTPDNHDTIEINPPPGLPLDPRPLYDTAGHCWPMT